MESPQDEKLASLVLRDRILTPAQLEECRGIQQRLQPPRSLAQIIVLRRYATPDTLRDLVSREVNRRVPSGSGGAATGGGSDLEREDVNLARDLIGRGILDEARARECLALTRKAREQRPDVRLFQIVLKKNYATREAVREALARIGAPASSSGPASSTGAVSAWGPITPPSRAEPVAPPPGAWTASPSSRGPMPTPPAAMPRPTVAPSSPPSRPTTMRPAASLGATTGTGPASEPSGVGLFGQPSAPQPLFGEASGIVRPMFGIADASSAMGAPLPNRGPSSRLAPISNLGPVVPMPAPRVELQKPWPQDPRGGYKTVELDPDDPGLPRVGDLRTFEDRSESPTFRGPGGPPAGDPFGEGRVDSQQWSAFDSAPRQNPPRDVAFGAPNPFLAPPEPSSFGAPGFGAPPANGFGGPQDAFGGPPPSAFAPSGFGAPPSNFGGPSASNQGFGAPPSAYPAAPPANGGFAFGAAEASGRAPGGGFGGFGGFGASAPDRPDGGDGGFGGFASEGPTSSGGGSSAASGNANPVALAQKSRPVTQRDGSSLAEKPPSRGGKTILLALLALVLLGGGGFGAWKVVSTRMEEQRHLQEFLEAARAQNRDPRVALKLGDGLPEALRTAPEVAALLQGLREDVKTLDDKDEAKRIVEALAPDAPARTRFDACENAIKLDRECARAYLERARARLVLGRQNGARELANARVAAMNDDLPKAIQSDPKLLDAYWELANLQELTPTGRDQMRAQLEKIRELDRDGWMGELAAGRLAALDRGPRAASEALDHFSKAIVRQGDLSLPYLYRARFRLATSDRAGALKDAEDALERARRSPDALVVYARAKSQVTRDFRGARADVDSAIAIDPTFAPAYGQRAILKYYENDVRGAEEDIIKALGIDEGEPLALMVKAHLLAYPRKGSEEFVQNPSALADARRILRLAIDRDERLAAALVLHGKLSLRDNDSDTALLDFNKALDIDPQNFDVLQLRAQIYLSQRKFTEARRDLDRACDVDPKPDRAFFNRARLGIEGEPRNYEGAIADLNKALAARSDFPQAYYYRAIAYFELKKYEEVVRDATTALGGGRDASWAYSARFLRGKAHLQLKNYSDAVSDLDEAKRKVPPGHPDARKIDADLRTARESLEKAQKDSAPPSKDDSSKPEKDDSSPEKPGTGN